jgi:oxygen-independent coproporphyrinogen-3 oxidase
MRLLRLLFRSRSGELINRYTAALVRELEIVAADLKPKTIFFGGGTPSLLNLRQWEQILRAMEKLNLLGAAEFTIECNPATVSADKSKLLRDFGVNRISMGVQSLDEKLLDRLGRDPFARDGLQILRPLAPCRFRQPESRPDVRHSGSDDGHLARDVERGPGHGSEHLSSYEVIYEDDTPLYEQLQAGEFRERGTRLRNV